MLKPPALANPGASEYEKAPAVLPTSQARYVFSNVQLLPLMESTNRDAGAYTHGALPGQWAPACTRPAKCKRIATLLRHSKRVSHPLPFARRQIHPAIAAGAAFAMAVLLGLLDLPPLPSVTVHLGFAPRPVTALSLAALCGLLAWHLAMLTVPPRAALVAAAMPAAILPTLLVPGAGLAALLPALVLSFWLLLKVGRQRTVAILVQCGATFAVISVAIPLLTTAANCFYTVTMTLACCFGLFSNDLRAANDNPLLKRSMRTRWFYATGGNVSFAPIQSGPMTDRVGSN